MVAVALTDGEIEFEDIEQMLETIGSKGTAEVFAKAKTVPKRRDNEPRMTEGVEGHMAEEP